MKRIVISALVCAVAGSLSACGGGGGSSGGSQQPGEQPPARQFHYFSGSHLGDGQEDWELWRTDGTSEGTTLVHNLLSSGSAHPSGMTRIGDRLFFTAVDDEREKLWVTEGEDGSLQALLSNDTMGYLGQLVAAGNTLFFVASTEDQGTELWRSDGTAAGTVMVTDLAPGACSSHPSSLTAFQEELFFVAVNSCIGRPGLWKTDGTVAGTVPVFAPSGGSYAANLTPWGNALYFSAHVGPDYGLWRTDGSEAGTTLVRNIRLSQNANIGLLTVAGNQLFFRANDGEHGTELWKSDGTETGTHLLMDIHPNGGSNPQWMIALGEHVYFAAFSNNEPATRLWRSDGSPEGTVELFDTDGNSVRNMRLPVIYRDALYFSASWDGRAPLWRLRHDDEAAERLHDTLHLQYASAAVLNDLLLFVADDGEHGDEWWRTAGSRESIELVRDICAGACPGIALYER